MFCPKCGTKNPEDGKFCRSCGVDIANVQLAMTGDSRGLFDLDCGTSSDSSQGKRPLLPHEVYGEGIKSLISGAGFMVVSLVLFMTNVVGGRSWWWALLFPAFTFLARGISDLMKYRKMEQVRTPVGRTATLNSFQPTNHASLPNSAPDYIQPEKRYQTGDLVPPSVTDSTTRLLELQEEEKTMALPKN